jgi:hypothetical protein
MNRFIRRKTAAITAVVAFGVAGGAYAATSGSSDPTPLTGTVTERIADAAQAKYPGATLVGIESAPDGTFAARVRKADGSQVLLVLDREFRVTDTREGGPFGHGGPGGVRGSGGPGFGDAAALAKALGVEESKLRDALEKVREAAFGERRDERVAAIAKALGAKESDVRAVLEDLRPDAGRGGPGRHGRGPGARGPGGELVRALARKTGRSESAVREALRSARPDRGARPDRDDRLDAVAQALAKELGIDAAKVKSALEAQRPKPPARP